MTLRSPEEETEATKPTRQSASVGIVIVSGSLKIAEGTAELIHQTVDNSLPIACAGGTTASGYRVEAGAITEAIRQVWSNSGVAVLVDLGSTETECEAAIRTMPLSWRRHIALCNAPLIEGAFMAALAAARGGDLETVRRVAEDL